MLLRWLSSLRNAGKGVKLAFLSEGSKRYLAALHSHSWLLLRNMENMILQLDWRIPLLGDKLLPPLPSWHCPSFGTTYLMYLPCLKMSEDPSSLKEQPVIGSPHCEMFTTCLTHASMRTLFNFRSPTPARPRP